MPFVTQNFSQNRARTLRLGVGVFLNFRKIDLQVSTNSYVVLTHRFLHDENSKILQKQRKILKFNNLK
jgi:hypothetical protein